MREKLWSSRFVIVAAVGLVLGISGQALSQRLGENPFKNTLKGRIAFATKLSEQDVNKVLEAIAPAARDLIGQGETVELPGMGTFRVIRVPEHKDMVDGRPATIAPANYIEFLPTGKFADAANQPGVRPAETVPPFQYNPLPDQVKGLKTPNTRTPSLRSP